MFRSFHKLCLLAALAAGLGGCTSHSIPIPPPDPEKVFFSLDLDAAQATFRYGGDPVYEGATVYVFNREIGEGIITTAGSGGSVMATTPFPAMQGDEVVISVETEGQLSSVCLEMRDGQSSNDQRCDL